MSDAKVLDDADDNYYSDPAMKNILDCDLQSVRKFVQFSHKDLELESGDAWRRMLVDVSGTHVYTILLIIININITNIKMNNLESITLNVIRWR